MLESATAQLIQAEPTSTHGQAPLNPAVDEAWQHAPAPAPAPTPAESHAVTKPMLAKLKIDQAPPPQATPPQATPPQGTPVKKTQAQATPVKATTAQAKAAKATPTKATPAKETPAKPTPSKATPVEATPAEGTPAKATTVQRTRAKARVTRAGSVEVDEANAMPSKAVSRHGNSPKATESMHEQKRPTPQAHAPAGSSLHAVMQRTATTEQPLAVELHDEADQEEVRALSTPPPQAPKARSVPSHTPSPREGSPSAGGGGRTRTKAKSPRRALDMSHTPSPRGHAPSVPTTSDQRGHADWKAQTFLPSISPRSIAAVTTPFFVESDPSSRELEGKLLQAYIKRQCKPQPLQTPALLSPQRFSRTSKHRTILVLPW